MVILLCLTATAARATEWNGKYDEGRPLVIAGDWDKAPYEFLNDDGKPAGMNIDLMRTLCEQLGIKCKFILKEWSGALKTFEREEADIIFANIKRYKSEPYVCSENIINYNRVCAATCSEDTTGVISTSTLLKKGLVLKPGDYTGLFFRNLDSLQAANLEYQSPTVALQGLLAGDYDYFCWGEEPLRWKIKELHLDGITLCDVDIPVSEVHIVGRDKELVYQLDDLYSRLKQSGGVQRINDQWLHPERIKESHLPRILFEGIAALVVGLLLYFFAQLAKIHVRKATRQSTEINEMMQKALEMGSFHIMVYDIRRDLMLNRYGTPILPEEGITLKEFTSRIHPDEQEEFERKMNSLLTGHERKFELKKRWRAYPKASSDGTQETEEKWLNLDGHAMVELDSTGKPAFVVNAIHNVTRDEETDKYVYEIGRKYERLSNTPLLAMSFYDSGGWLLDINDKMKEICGMTPDNPDAQRFWTKMCLFDIPFFRNVYKLGAKEGIQACMYMHYSDMDINRCVEYHVLPLLDLEGQVVNYYVTTIDLTDERNMYRRLTDLRHELHDTTRRIELQKQWLNFLLQNSDRYIMYRQIGNRQIAFYRQADEPDYVHDFDDFCNNYLVDADNRPFRETFCTAAPRQMVIHLKKRSDNLPGTVFNVSAIPVTDSKGRTVAHEGIVADITRLDTTRKQLERLTAEAKDSVRMKSGFMASMTHELRTPLNAIIGFTSVLDVLGDNGERAEYVRIIQNSSDMLQRLITDITQASSMIEGPTSIKRETIDFAKAFDDICFTVQYRVQNPEVKFIKDVGGNAAGRGKGTAGNAAGNGELFLNVDVGRIQQVITNFVTNAVKFTKKGHIRLGYSCSTPTNSQPQELYVYCEDTGMGIPEDKKQIIFERFVKLDEFVQGTGMGLAICKSIVEHMGGTIGVDSPGIGKGSTFWFRIPVERPPHNSQ